MSQIRFPNQPFAFGQFFVDVQDNNGDPTSVLEAGAPFKVETKWEIPALAALLLGGVWTVTTTPSRSAPAPRSGSAPRRCR